jgi:hypothetical protein
MPKFRVTYEIVTPESAEHGDAEERGFVAPGGWQDELSTVPTPLPDVYEMDLRSAVQLTGDCLENCGRWFVQYDGCTNYRTGAETRYSLHPPDNITPASYDRLARLLRAC